MAGLVERFYGLHSTHTATLFEALVLGVLGQQIAANVARIIRTLIIEQFGLSAAIDGRNLLRFPSSRCHLGLLPRRTADDEADPAKVRIHTRLGRGGARPRNRPERLGASARRGGAPTAGFLAGNRQMDSSMGADPGLSRPNALPLGDLALRRVVSRLYFDGQETTDAQVEALARQWEPHRTYATVYLFTALRYGVE